MRTMTARKVRLYDGRGKKDQPLERSWSFFPAAAAVRDRRGPHRPPAEPAVLMAESQDYRLANCAMYRS